MNKPIAILSSDFYRTLDWARITFDLVEINFMLRMLIDSKGQQYCIIIDPQQALGREFSSYIKAPDYIDLETIIQSRVR